MLISCSPKVQEAIHHARDEGGLCCQCGGDQLEDLDCFLNIAYYLVAESLALSLVENFLPISEAEGSLLGLSLLEPHGFKRDCNMCEPHALCVGVGCLILSFACLWASCFQRTVAIFCKMTWQKSLGFCSILLNSIKKEGKCLFLFVVPTFQTALKWKNKKHFSWLSNLFWWAEFTFILFWSLTHSKIRIPRDYVFYLSGYHRMWLLCRYILLCSENVTCAFLGDPWVSFDFDWCNPFITSFSIIA